ncbi:MAG: Asp-tRNA(Asn)/Glu-tRNA(Gln) amidotransferase subunit GatC [SAR324 cluster bacterium]|nr:Asp-tRNA(Asn)/Glu-tRNA(Gln) amidotransferase subunit GatC [SAR324 cluster bacterium]
MKITEKDVRYVAALAHLDLTEKETAQYVAELDSILTYVEKLNQIDTSTVEPMAQVLHKAAETDPLREDRDRQGFRQEQSLGNAPESGAGHFKVAKVIAR